MDIVGMLHIQTRSVVTVYLLITPPISINDHSSKKSSEAQTDLEGVEWGMPNWHVNGRRKIYRRKGEYSQNSQKLFIKTRLTEGTGAHLSSQHLEGRGRQICMRSMPAWSTKIFSGLST